MAIIRGKELALLHSVKCKVETVETNHLSTLGKETRYVVAFSLTAGELLALGNMCEASYDLTGSAVQADVRAFLINALERACIKL